MDIPVLTKEYANGKTAAHPSSPEITLVDPIPGLRLATACEALANTVYGMADIAATVANRASNGIVPSSFNALCKKYRERTLPEQFASELGELEWYARIRELRTEWTNNSSIFVAGKEDDPVLCVSAFRRGKDKVHFEKESNFKPAELIDWALRAVASVDDFGAAVFKHFVFRRMPMDEEVYMPERDEIGFFKVQAGRLIGKKVSAREYLAAGGIQFGKEAPPAV